MSNRAFNEVRVTYGVNKPWILSNLAGRTGGSGLLEAAGYNTDDRQPDRQVRVDQLSRRDVRRHVLHRARRRGESVHRRQFLGDRRASTQFKLGAQLDALEDVHGCRSVTQGSLDLHTGPGFRRRTIHRAFRPLSAATSDPARLIPPRGTRRSMRRTRGRPTSNLTLNLGVRYDLDNTPTTVNDYVDPYNERIVAAARRRAAAAKSVSDKNNIAPRLGVVWVPTASRHDDRARAAFGLYYDQNHWNFTDIYLNETLLALRRINLNANSQANNPFWTPGQHCGRHRADARVPGRELSRLSGPERPAVPAGDYPRRGAGLQDPVRGEHLRRGDASRSAMRFSLTRRLRAYRDAGPQHRSRHELGTRTQMARSPGGIRATGISRS